MNEEILPVEYIEDDKPVSYRSISAWILMVMFIGVTPVGTALATESLGVGLTTFGITSLVAALIIGNS